MVRRVQAGGAERGDVLRDQERLLLRMERKGEHIAQLHRHTQQVKDMFSHHVRCGVCVGLTVTLSPGVVSSVTQHGG